MIYNEDNEPFAAWPQWGKEDVAVLSRTDTKVRLKLHQKCFQTISFGFTRENLYPSVNSDSSSRTLKNWNIPAYNSGILLLRTGSISESCQWALWGSETVKHIRTCWWEWFLTHYVFIWIKYCRSRSCSTYGPLCDSTSGGTLSVPPSWLPARPSASLQPRTLHHQTPSWILEEEQACTAAAFVTAWHIIWCNIKHTFCYHRSWF